MSIAQGVYLNKCCDAALKFTESQIFVLLILGVDFIKKRFDISVTGFSVDLACGVIMVVCIGYTTIVSKYNI